LVGGEAFSIDASLIKADVDQTKRMPGDEAVDWPKPEEASRDRGVSRRPRRGENGRFTRDDFSYDKERNVYLCPGGKLLTSTGNIDQGRILYYRALKSDCSACSLKPQCTTGPVRKVTRDVGEEVRDRVRALAHTEAFQQSRRERKKVEMLFAHMKRILRAMVPLHPQGTEDSHVRAILESPFRNRKSLNVL
jgi:hypothetical protein